MSQPTFSRPAPEVASMHVDDLERGLVNSTPFAWGLIAGLPALGLVASLCAGLPVFAALMAASFLLATAFTCRWALAAFTDRAVQLLVATRLVAVLVLGAVLFCAHGSAWVLVVSSVLLWLTTDRLLGRSALADLWHLGRDGD